MIKLFVTMISGSNDPYSILFQEYRVLLVAFAARTKVKGCAVQICRPIRKKKNKNAK